MKARKRVHFVYGIIVCLLICLLTVPQFLYANETGCTECFEIEDTIQIQWAETYVQGTGDTIQYMVVNGMAVFEGDIILGEHETVQSTGVRPFVLGPSTREGRIKRSAYYPGITKWPNGDIYDFDSSYYPFERQLMREAMDEIESACGATFIPRTNQDNYIHFEPGNVS